MKPEINIGIDTSQSQLDIFVRPLNVFFSVENTPQGVKKAITKLRSFSPERILIDAMGCNSCHRTPGDELGNPGSDSRRVPSLQGWVEPGMQDKSLLQKDL